jgi:hypothetical protein
MTECDFCGDVAGAIHAVDPDGLDIVICAECMWLFDSFE